MKNSVKLSKNEIALLTSKLVANKVSLKAIENAINEANDLLKKRFESSLKLAKLASNFSQWFDSEQGKQTRKDFEVKTSKSELAEKIFLCKKAYFYRLVDAGNVQSKVLSAFNKECDKQGTDAKRSIIELVKFNKLVLSASNDKPINNGTIATALKTKEAKAKKDKQTSENTVFTMSFKREIGNIALRINTSGIVTTTNTAKEIQDAITFLSNALKAQSVSTAKVKKANSNKLLEVAKQAIVKKAMA